MSEGAERGHGVFDGEGLSLEPVAAFLEPRHREYREEVAAFCRRRLRDAPDPDDDALARQRTQELVALMGQAGLFRPIATRDVRGCLVAREALAWWSPLADAAFALQALSATPALIFGDEAASDADPGHADLHRADLGHADPSHADLHRADLGHADPSHADLNRADRGHTDRADPSHADLNCADLGHADRRHPDCADPSPVAWSARALSGQAVGAFAMTEWDAGSDVASIATTAVRDGDDYRIDGGKAFISNAGIAKFYVLFVKTGSAATNSRESLSCFVLSADKIGIDFVKELVMSTAHPLGEVRFDGCRVPATARLGDEGDGFKIGMATLDRLRPTVAAAANGMAGRALWEAVRHARTREQFGRPLGSFQLVRQKLADSAIDLTAGRLLAYRAAWETDRGAERVTVEAAMAKAFSTEAAQRVVDRAVQVLGGRGVLADHPVDRLYRAVRALRIYEGATEIQQLIVGGALVKGTP